MNIKKEIEEAGYFADKVLIETMLRVHEIFGEITVSEIKEYYQYRDHLSKEKCKIINDVGLQFLKQEIEQKKRLQVVFIWRVKNYDEKSKKNRDNSACFVVSYSATASEGSN